VADPELPDDPVIAWRERHNPWWTTAIGIGLLTEGILEGVGERQREVAVSVNGIRADNRFLPWDEIDGIVEADDPELGAICLVDGTTVRLDRWHLPAGDDDDRRTAKAERLALLRRALVTGRDPTGPDPTARDREPDQPSE
jgi:hypothetical protein